MVEGLIAKIENELQVKTIRIITGGLSEIFKEPLFASNIIHHHQPDLTLEGLKIVFEKIKLPKS
jgi:pantothenate kinase type III